MMHQQQQQMFIKNYFLLTFLNQLSLGGAMVKHTCKNGHAICKDLGSSRVPPTTSEVFLL